MDGGSITSFAEDLGHLAQEGAVGRQALPVALALDDDLVAGVGQAVQGAVAENGVVEEAEPFLHGPVAGDDEAGGPVLVDDQLIEVGGLLGGEAMEAQIVRGRLQSAGIPAIVRGESMGRIYGFIYGGLAERDVLVPAALAESAEEILSEEIQWDTDLGDCT